MERRRILDKNILYLAQTIHSYNCSLFQFLNKVLHPTEITVAQYFILNSLRDLQWWHEGYREHRMSKKSKSSENVPEDSVVQIDLARHLGLNVSTISRDIKPLLKKEFVFVSNNPFDNREKWLKLTPKGLDVVGKASKYLSEHFKTLEIPDDLAPLLEHLGTLIKTIQQM